MGQNTSRLGLYLPGGGSTGLITPDEPADIDKINDNMTKLDADAGAYVCTSSTRPATPYNGKIIFETDTRKTMVYKSATTSWEPVDSQGKIVANAAARDALFASPTQGTKVFRTDTGVTETYYAAWNASTNPGGKTPAGWYVAERSTGLVPIVPPTVNFSGGSATANTLGVVSFTAVTSISLNGVFTSAYSNYRVVFNGKNSAATNLNFRFRTSGTDVSAGYYGVSTYATYNSGITAADQRNNAGDTFFGGGNTSAGVSITSEIQPEAGSSKIFNNISLAYLGGLQICSYSATTGTRPDGFTIYPVSGNMTGTVQVFGYNS